MSPVLSQPSSVNVSRVFLLAEVAGEHAVAAQLDLAVVGQPQLDARDGGPTVPILTFSGGLQAPIAFVSLIPHSSPSGRPMPWKNSITSGGHGAAPTLSADSWSIPSCSRSGRIRASAASSRFARRTRSTP